MGWDWVHLVRRPLLDLLWKPRTKDEFGAFGGMRIVRGNWRIRWNLASVPLCPPQIPRDLFWDWTNATVWGLFSCGGRVRICDEHLLSALTGRFDFHCIQESLATQNRTDHFHWWDYYLWKPGLYIPEAVATELAWLVQPMLNLAHHWVTDGGRVQIIMY
jgi:hypothetical protein